MKNNRRRNSEGGKSYRTLLCLFLLLAIVELAVLVRLGMTAALLCLVYGLAAVTALCLLYSGMVLFSGNGESALCRKKTK